jgi:uncharacterized membrane protein YbhN (UPF0104 family)
MIGSIKHSGIIQKLFVSAIIMLILFLGMDTTKLSLSLDQVHNSAWIIAAALISFQILALSYRWLILINVYRHKISFSYALKTNIVSMIANYLFITSIGGIITRVAMSVKSGVSLTRSIAATGLDRLFTLLALLVLTVIFLPILSNVIAPDIFSKTLGLIFVSILGAIVLYTLLFEAPRKKIIFSHRKIAMCFQYLRFVLTNHNVLAKTIFASLIGQLAYFGAVYCVLSSMGVEFAWLSFMAIIPVITIISSLPIGYGGWGVREGAYIAGLGIYGIPAETAFSASIQIGIISMGVAIIAAIPTLINSNILSSLTYLSKSKDYA